jgi:hypothetical protein
MLGYTTYMKDLARTTMDQLEKIVNFQKGKWKN